MESFHDSKHLKELIKLTSKCSNRENCESKALDVHTASHIITSLIHRSLFLEIAPLLPEISRDGWAIYSYVRHGSHNEHLRCSAPDPMNECLVKLTKMQPVKSYLKLSFQQFINFLLEENSGTNLVDVDHLMSFVNELRIAFSTLCLANRQLIRQAWKEDSCDSFGDGIDTDASFLSNWSTIEAAKYCICRKFAPCTSANKFLALLQNELSSTVCLGNKVSRLFLVNFLHVLEKYVHDRIAESSTGKLTFIAPNDVDKFYEAKRAVFGTWLQNNRDNMARLNLTIDNPAECLRNVSVKIRMGFSSKSYGQRYRGIPIKHTLAGLKTENWRPSLGFIASSAKQLVDLPLLHGIQTLIGSDGFLGDHKFLAAITSNLEGRYQITYDNLSRYSENLADLDLIEFLDSCIELGVLDENIHHADKLMSTRTRDLYKNYSRSRSQVNLAPLRLEELEQWLKSWTDMTGSSERSAVESQPMKSTLDLVVPSCLNIISKEPLNQRLPLLERTEWFISQDFIAQCLFIPNVLNTNVKIFHVLIELLKKEVDLPEDLVQAHAKDLYWNHSLYRHLCDLNLIGRLKKFNSTVEIVQYRAAKFNLRHDNLSLATKIADDLKQTANSCKMRILSSLLLMKDFKSNNNVKESLFDLVKQVEDSSLEGSIKSDIISKVVRRIVRLHHGDNKQSDVVSIPPLVDGENLVQAVAGVDLPNGWRSHIDSSGLISKTRTYLMLSKQLEAQFKSHPDNSSILNMAFSLDLDLIDLLAQSTKHEYKSFALECATRLLSIIVSGHEYLTDENLQRFSSEIFIESTMSVWIVLKSNLISLVFNDHNLHPERTKVLMSILKMIGKFQPNLLIYSIVMNRLDLRNDISRLSNNHESFKDQEQELCALLIRSNTGALPDDGGSNDRKLEDCRAKFALWNELLDYIKSESFQDKTRWINTISDTEAFLKELRRISFLNGEYLKAISATITKKLNTCLKYFKKFADPHSNRIREQHLGEFEKRLKTNCDYALKSIKILSSYGNREGEFNLTRYDNWFFEEFTKQLKELDYRINLLSNKKNLTSFDLEKLVKSVTELLKMCQTTLIEYNRNNRQKLHMELISPWLSRLNSSHIPMPDCCDRQSSGSMKPIVTVNKVSQTVNLIHSKTCPKKLTFLGSDGVSRSFLLKAHEDLRLDQFIMELFASINRLLISKKTQNIYQIRRYSVTPISSQSGLIQWVKAPSLCSTYRTWLNGPSGKRISDELYAITCEAVCRDPESSLPRHSHKNCQPPVECQSVDLFYQLLWVETRSFGHSKPSVGDSVEYRTVFDSSVFSGVVAQLSERVPEELFSQELWYSSNNAHSFWVKTQRFINSIATMSIVGYVIGLGDRHLDNILIDQSTGEIIHIDYNICFELGKALVIPEKVPFRLTRNIIHAFGFAGLQGGFKLACRNVLATLRERKATLLHLVDEVNLSFMQIRGHKIVVEGDCNKLSSNFRPFSPTNTTTPLSVSGGKASRIHNNQLEMCSQESIELKPTTGDVTDLLTMIQHSAAKNVKSQVANNIEPKPSSNESPRVDSQHNIKTTAETVKVASYIQERMRDKLSGTDESLRNRKRFYDARQFSDPAEDEVSRLIKQDDQAIDLIQLDDSQSVEDQVDALISDATSLVNQAKMFEGWLPWV